jgi:TonB family protein
MCKLGMKNITQILSLILVPALLAIASFTLRAETNYSQATPRKNNPKPLYPSMSLRLGEQGTVVLRILVKNDGSAGSVEIKSTSGFPRIDNAAIDATKFWRFNPATRDGSPIDEWYEIPIVMRISENDEEIKPVTTTGLHTQHENNEIKDEQKILITPDLEELSDTNSLFALEKAKQSEDRIRLEKYMSLMRKNRQSKWEFTDEGDHGDYYHEKSTIRKSFDGAFMWTLENLYFRKKFNEKWYRSQKILYHYNCKDDLITLQAVVQYRDFKGKGEIQLNLIRGDEGFPLYDYRNKLPYPILQKNKAIACDKKNHLN